MKTHSIEKIYKNLLKNLRKESGLSLLSLVSLTVTKHKVTVLNLNNLNKI